MMPPKREAPGEPRADHSLAADGESNSIAKVIHSNNSYFIFRNGQRIASFLNRSKAVSFAEAVTL